jgi:Ca2+-binding EF-hand superfamily protein
VLTAAEILNALSIAPQATPAGLSMGPAGKDTPSVTLGFPARGRATLRGKDSRFQLSPDGSVLSVPGGTCVVTLAQDDPAAGLRAAKGFYLAQFQAAAGNKPAAKSVFEDDPTAQVLASLFDTADRNGDGKLTRAELEGFFDLIEAGVGCRVMVMASDRGRNLFDILDANGDGRLDLSELIRAGRELPGKLAATKPLTREAVPASYRLSVGRGSVGDTFGPVPLAAITKPKPTAKAPATGPRWFLAMDRNGDGYVSMAEFLGSAELFRKLDTDGDGRISAAEAVAAGK